MFAITAAYDLKQCRRRADCVDMRPVGSLQRSGALLIVLVAIGDVAYRVLVRRPVRRALGMRP
jgi:hypothetical protein